MSLENNVIISIKGQQAFDGTDEETVELVTEGILERDPDAGYTLSYQESEVTGMDGTLTTFQIEKDCVTLLRVGEFTSQMVVQEGRRHMSLYETPYGSMSLGINTRRMRASIGDKGGDIEIDYNIEIDHKLAGVNFFQINVREKRPAHSLSQ